MIPFNWRHLFRQAFYSVVGTAGTHRRLTPRRLKVMTVFWALFIPHQAITRICLFLDNIFYPGWRKVPVSQPIFITGLFRSGTTYLHRLLAGDGKNFSTFRTWEIYLAPSILQRKVLKTLKKLDRLLGSPAMKWLRRYDKRSLGEVKFHEVGLWKEEEDEGLFLFLWDSLFTWFFFPDSRGIDDYRFADREMEPRRQERKYRFYRACIRRHLYSHPNTPIYLSKNPAFTPKLGSLRAAFPDARIIYMVRDPRRVLVSQAAWFSFCWHYFASPTEKYPFRDELLAMTLHWYTYPLALFGEWNKKDYLIVEYKNLIARPVETIGGLYSHFNIEMDAKYESWLTRESKDTQEYSSAGRLTPLEVGFDETEITERFSDVFGAFDFGP